MDDDRAVSGEGSFKRLAQSCDVVAVDDTDVGPVELFPKEARRPECLQRLLELGAKLLDLGADAGREVTEAILYPFAGMPKLGVQPNAGEVARERADVGGDRHAVVVQHDNHRRTEAAGLVNRLEGHPPGHRPVADHGGDAALVGAPEHAHPFLQSNAVADRS